MGPFERISPLELQVDIDSFPIERNVLGSAVCHVAGTEKLSVREKEVFALSRDPDTFYEINVSSDVTSTDYYEDTPKEIWDLLEESIKSLKDKRVVLLSSTYEGGGVAMQIPPLTNFMREHGVDIHWLVAEPDDDAFLVTKKMHNLQQNVMDPAERFTDKDKATHRKFGMSNCWGMKEKGLFDGTDVFWFEDPQLVGMLPELMKEHPDAQFVYRNHIQTDGNLMATEGSPQKDIWEYLRDELKVGSVNTYVAHPPEEFWPHDVADRVVPIPPVSDMFEDLTRPVANEEKDEKLDWIDSQISDQNERQREHNTKRYGEKGAHIDDQPALDRDRRWLTGFARFDLAKGQATNMELQLRIVQIMQAMNVDERLIPQTIVAGNGATDDPDRAMVLNSMLELRRTKYKSIEDYITVIGLEHDYVAVNTLISKSMYTENFSIAEGWEHRRTESMAHGVPSISSDAGGLPYQGREGQGGHVAKLDDLDNELDRIAYSIIETIVDVDLYEKKREGTLEWFDKFGKPELTTVANVIRYARAMRNVADKIWEISNLVLVEVEPVNDGELVAAKSQFSLLNFN